MKKIKDKILPFLWIFLGITISIWSATFPFGSLKAPGPAFLPLGTGLALILLAILLLKAEKGEKGNSLPRPNPAALKRVFFCLAGMLLAAALLKILGFVLTMFLMILFMMRTIDPQKWGKALGYSLISAFASWSVFKLLLKASLPSGFAGF